MKVTLLSPHEHAGVSYPAGAEIDVPDHDVQFLMNVGACVFGDPAAVAPPVTDDALTVSEAVERAAKGRRG